MKFNRFILLGCCMFVFLQTRAQNCSESPYSKTGSEIIMTEYNEKDGTEKIIKTIVVSAVSNEGNVTSQLRSIKTDNNGKVEEDKNITRQCDANGILYIHDAIDSKTKKPASLSYPADMKKGQQLNDDLNYSYSAKNEEGQKVKFTVKIYNRKVMGEERVVLRSGVWDCTKLTYDFNLKLKLGIIGIPIEAKVIEWFNPAVGVVKNETYFKGELASHSEITSIKE